MPRSPTTTPRLPGYRQTTLTAFQEVEDNLAALRILEMESGQQHAAVVSAENSLRILNDRYLGGVDTYLVVLIAQQTLLANQRSEADLLRRRVDASALLIKALGGGWQTKDLPSMVALRRGTLF
jgi:outer membrane protein TolC